MKGFHRAIAVGLTALFLVFASASGMAARRDSERSSFCGSCEFQVGMGGTYHSFESTGGEVIPLTMTWSEGRWELGPKGIRFVHEAGESQITPDKARPRMNRIGPHWFRLAARFGL